MQEAYVGQAEDIQAGKDAGAFREAGAEAKVAKRVPVDYLYSKLNWDFIKMMAQIAQYAESKYGAAEQFTESRLTGEKEPINHVFEHARQYLVGEVHDHFGTHAHQLASIAYNAMMQYFYHICGADGPCALYGARELPPSSIDILRARAQGSGPLTDTPLSTAPGQGPRQAHAYIPGGIAKAVEILESSLPLHAQRADSFKKV